MRLHPLLRRRPSAPLIISSLALFMSVGGVGYAATQLPANSVGTSQLRNGSVSYRKIQPGAVGAVRANLGQLQARVTGSCAPDTAVVAISRAGKPACESSLPYQNGVTNSEPVSTTPALIDQLYLSVTPGDHPDASRYLEIANPTATVTGNGTAQRVTVVCTLDTPESDQSRTATIDVPASTEASSASIPLELAAGSGESGVNCTSSSSATPAATVTVTSSLYAIQTRN